MIFFCNAEGTINAVVSSPVYQGSNYANEVVFVAPFVPVSVVTVSFIKPNGEYTPAALMTVKELTGIKDEKGNAFNAWTYLVPEAYTEYSGILTAQFKVTNGNTVLATASSSFNVQKGVPNVTPEPPEDIYQQILSALSELKQDVENLENGTTEVGKAKEAEKAEQAEYYTTASGDKSVNTIETQFLNKLDKQTGVPSYPQVYAVEGNTQKLIPVSNGSTIAPNDRIAQYTSRGTLFTQPPETDSDTTNKGYVDGEIKKSNDEQMVINERIVEILDGIEIVKVNDLEYNLMVDETIKGTINIPKDQFLKSVSYDPETHVLTFIFLTSDGEVTTTIDMSSLVDVYQAGNGLTLANNTFSIKLDPSSNNALTLSAAGLMLDNTPLEKAAEDIEILNSDIPKSAKETGAFISGDNTLAGAKAEVEIGSKNLLELKLIDVVSNGITYTQNSDGSITANGIATGRSHAYIINYNTPIKPGIYTLSGCPSGGSTSTYRINLSLNSNGVWKRNVYDAGDSVTFEVALPINQISSYIEIVSGTTVENLTFYPQLEYGETATAYTPYLPAGTAVEVNACGKNLFDINAIPNANTAIDNGGLLSNAIVVEGNIIRNTVSQYNNLWAINVPINVKKGKVTLSATVRTPDENYNQISFDLRGYNSVVPQSVFLDTTGSEWQNIARTFTVPQEGIVYVHIQNIKDGTGANREVEFYNVQLEYSESGTIYETFEGKTYQSEVGQTIEVEQYDGVTNIISNTTGAAVSTQFLQSTRYELDTKPVSLAGTYAERPTGTYPYVVLYTATDTGRTYRLERDTDGSVSSNWVNISSAGGTGGGFTPRGEWNSTTTYSENDLVSLNGSSYVCIEENTNATPASNPDKWMVNAEKGATGATGTTGPAGTDGHSVYTANDTCGATEIGQVCCMLKSSTNAKGIGDVIISQDGKVFTVTTENDTSWCGPITALIKGSKGDTGARGDGWYRVDSDYLDTVTSIPRNVIYPTTPATLNVNETVIFSSGRLASVASQSGDTVTVTLRDIYFKGPAGANGTNGKDYLIYKDGTITGSSNVSSFSTMVNNEDFNRTPVIGEYFICNYEESNSVGALKIYSCIFEVALVGDTQTLVSVFQYKLVYTDYYEHHITFNQNGVARAIFTITNSRKSTYSTVGDLISYLEPQKPYQMNGWYRESSSNICWGVSCIITTDGKLNFIFCGNSGEVSYEVEEDEIITDLTIKL